VVRSIDDLTTMIGTRVDRVWFAVCGSVYLAVATRLTDGLGRTQFDNSAFAHFFDFQTDALLRGDLALQKDSIGLEAFVVDGKDQMYFGLFPALLRLPIAAVTDRFFGHLTIVSAFAAWVLFVVAVWTMTDRVVAGRSEALVRVWKVGVALGSPMLALAGSAWVFNEAIMWGVASCAWFQLRLLCELQQPSTRHQAWLGASIVLVVLNRPTFGLGCLIVTAAVLAARGWRTRSVGPAEWRVGAALAVGTVLLVVPNLLRFGRLFGPPMEAQGLSMFDEHRMRMLDYSGGDYVDPRYLPTNLVAYLRPDGLSVGTRFPFVTAPETIPTRFGDVIHDITYRTPSLSASTPLLVALAMFGLVLAGRELVRGARHERTLHLITLAAAGMPAAVALMVWGFIAPRYLGDFVPVLVPLALLAVCALSDAPSRRKLIGVGVLAAWSIIASIGIALATSYERGYDGDVAEYLRLQGRSDVWTDTARLDDVSGFAFDRDEPPRAGAVRVLGACEAAYFSTGEQVDPWLVAGYGPNEFRREYQVTISPDADPLEIVLAGPDVPDEFDVTLVVDDGSVRIDLADRFGAVPYPLSDVTPATPFRLGITSDPVHKVLTFEVDGQAIGYGHVLTRSLYGPSGQTARFSDDVTIDGSVADVVPAPDPC
jgi:hypothetical protein